ncbi:MAG TPA: hypothetical protein VN325_35830, partial [Steroidobacteraceae bacterium]|nr:hypothetical protein [Steroidobacteraceae bacterium]
KLETRLMQRSTRKLTLTSAGVAFYERCAPAVDSVLNAGKAIAGRTQTPWGTVRVAAACGFLGLFQYRMGHAVLGHVPKSEVGFRVERCTR